MITVEDVEKHFTLHTQGGAVLPVVQGARFHVARGTCVGLIGPSGAGKSSILRMIYGNYLTGAGRILVGETDVASAKPREILNLRRETLGYVSQFLRVVPRVPTLTVVAEPLIRLGVDTDVAETRAADLLTRLNVPERLWSLSPLTFSGGEQQRVNVARGFIHPYPALLLDEPTASLDVINRDTVLSLIEEARDGGAAILGIFHDPEIRARICTEEVDVTRFAAAAA